MTTEEYLSIPENAVFRVVTTKYHDIETGSPELTFVCKKESGQEWAIYYSFAEKTVAYIASYGTKLQGLVNILEIFPCSEKIYDHYRH